MKGIFLGAGASYEVGMPLVNEFTNTLRVNILKRLNTKLFDFKSNIKLKETFIQLLNNKNLNYEEMIGELEKINKQEANRNSATYGLIIQTIEVIQILLREEQNNTLELFKAKINDYSGIKELVEKEVTLNIFSLNHDTVFEEIFDFYKIPWKDGFYNIDTNYSHITNFKSITSKQLNNLQLDLFKLGEKGANLIKLHGSLDIFQAEDRQIFLKSYGDGSFIGSHMSALDKLEKHNQLVCTLHGIRATNELSVYDNDKKWQFLRRSLLSGANKFKNNNSQIAPVAFLQLFKNKLNLIDELICIGYSFGDSHINDIILNWLSISSSTKIIIYDPYRTSPPVHFKEYYSQIHIVQGGLTDFLSQYNSDKKTLLDKSDRELLNISREILKRKRLEEKTILG